MKLIYLILISALFSLSSCGPNSDITFDPFAGITQNSDEEADTGPETLIISGIFAADNNARDGKVFCIAQGEELSTCTAEIDDSDGSFARFGMGFGLYF